MRRVGLDGCADRTEECAQCVPNTDPEHAHHSPLGPACYSQDLIPSRGVFYQTNHHAGPAATQPTAVGSRRRSAPYSPVSYTAAHPGSVTGPANPSAFGDHMAARRPQTTPLPTAETFTELGVPANLSKILAAAGITRPTPIQAATLPDTLAGRDVLARGQTGSGK